MNRCRTIAVFNHKGGVGKTTTAVNLAAALAQQHQLRCLVIDLDPQANATRALLNRELNNGEPSIRDVLLSDPPTQEQVNNTIVQSTVPNVFVCPATLNLSEAEFRLAARPRRELLLQDQLHLIASSFDYIIIDCPPSLGLLALNALAAADSVIVPCETQFLSLRGLGYVLDVIELVQKRLNPKLTVLGAIATKYYIISRANQEALNCLKGLKHIHTFRTVIPRDVKAEEAPSHGQPIITYAPESRSAKAYINLAEEVIHLCQKQNQN